MAFVVVEPCIKCKYTDCVAVCPVDCFREGKNFLVIDPHDCIDCGVCVAECPVYAIFPEDEVPEKWHEYVALNEKLATTWPPITKVIHPPVDAEEFRLIEEKRHLLDMEAPSS